MNTFLPFCLISVAVIDAEMIFVELGALLGLSLFFRGFHLLQSHRPTLTVSDQEKAPTQAMEDVVIPKRDEPLSLECHREIIRLSPTNGEEDVSRVRTQQGQIAAALLRAGIASPISWSAPEQVFEVSVRTVEGPADGPDAPPSLIRTLDRNASTTLQEGFRISKAAHLTEPQDFHWKPALMIWGGPILTLGCIYLLAMHYGWL